MRTSDFGHGAAEAIGAVVSARGSHLTLGLVAGERRPNERATVGRFVGIRIGDTNLIGAITEIGGGVSETERLQGFGARAVVDLMGEIRRHGAGGLRFERGVSTYPAIGDVAALLGAEDLRVIFNPADRSTITIGTLQQDSSIPVSINVDDLISRHFAVLGTTGVGKSSGVVNIVDGILKARPDLRIFLVDSHNEYGRCFGDKASVITPRNLRLPFWLFNFEEIVDIIYGGRPAPADEIDILAELIPIAKSTYGQHKAAGDRLTLKRGDAKSTGFTVDTPVPYMLQDLLSLIDERMGRLDNRSSRMTYHRLMTRIETIRNDPRYAFMFENANVGGDMMGELLTHLFRLKPQGRPMTIMQLGGLPAEGVDAVVCVLARLACEFGLWSEGAVPLLFICEEAHRYASADPTIGFNPTRRALSRIAKEGRKYSVFLGLVTQRPAELDPTIISQCSTLFAMRMANDRDQALLRSAVSDAAANLLSFVPSLGTREVIGFGEGVSLPVRMTFAELPAHRLPRTEASGCMEDGVAPLDRDFIDVVVERWRGATMSTKQKPEETPEREVPTAIAAAPRQTSTIDQARFRLLKRPLELGDVGTPPAT
jgi:DNA helicase HerA-like ATPase